MKIEKRCPFCGTVNTIKVSVEGYEQWKNGAFVQDAFPKLSLAEREVLISGCCPDCWDKYMVDNEEDL